MTSVPSRFGEVLEAARTLGAVGPGEDTALIEHSEGFAGVIGDVDGPLLDLGSGGGIPGLVLAYLFDVVPVTLLEAQQRRADHLRWAVAMLGLGDRVEVLEARAEDAARRAEYRGHFAVATARSFGSPAVVVECAVPFLRSGGRLVVSEPPDAPGTRWDGAEHVLPVVGPRYHQVSGGAYAVLSLTGAIPDSLPRKPGRAERDPLF